MTTAILDEPEAVSAAGGRHRHDRLLRRWGVLAAVAAFTIVAHVWQLGRRAMAHDEAIDANFSWKARSFGVIKYDPVYHGPLRFYLEGFVLQHFGTTPGWTRFVAALAGIVATMVIATSTRLLGRFGAPAAAVIFTISPTILTVTRTGREDSLVGLVSLALIVIVADALIAVRPRHIVGAAALLAASFGLKETTFIFGFAGTCFFVGAAIVAMRRPNGAARAFWSRLKSLGNQPWMWAFVAFVFIFLLIFTSAFRYAAGFKSGLVDGITYWWSQHSVRRGSQRWFFYLTIYAGYEWLLLGAALLGAIVSVRRRSLVGAWLMTMMVVQLALYSWAGEKFAWLALHPLIPAVLLAGIGAQAAFDALRAPRPNRRMLLVTVSCAVIVILVGTSVIAVRPAITDGANPAELLVTVQTSDAVPVLRDRLAAARRAGEIGPILIDQRDSGSWPWSWYLHGFSDVAYVTIDPTQPLPDGYDAYIVSASTAPPAVPEGFTLERFPFRSWWLPDYDDVGFTDVLRWFVSRRTWNPTGSSDQYLIVRTSPPVPAAAADAGG